MMPIMEMHPDHIPDQRSVSVRCAPPSWSCEGFTLVESLMAIFIITIGLSAVGQMMFVSLAGPALARAKGTAVMVAQDRLEILDNEYRQNPNGINLTLGAHSAVQVAVLNTVDGKTLNRFNVAWTVSAVSDPRAGWTLQAKQILVTVTPIRTTGTDANTQRGLNKVVNATTILSPRW